MASPLPPSANRRRPTKAIWVVLGVFVVLAVLVVLKAFSIGQLILIASRPVILILVVWACIAGVLLVLLRSRGRSESGSNFDRGHLLPALVLWSTLLILLVPYGFVFSYALAIASPDHEFTESRDRDHYSDPAIPDEGAALIVVVIIVVAIGICSLAPAAIALVFRVEPIHALPVLGAWGLSPAVVSGYLVGVVSLDLNLGAENLLDPFYLSVILCASAIPIAGITVVLRRSLARKPMGSA